MRRSLLVAALITATSTSTTLGPRAAHPPEQPPIAALEDYRTAAGRRTGDTLDVALDAQLVNWQPEGPDGPTLPAYTFAERGKPGRVPGVMLRVPAGTLIRATLRNTTAVPLVVFGLQDHPAGAIPDSTALAPNASRAIEFRATSPGTYYYWGRTRVPGAKLYPSFDKLAGGDAAEGPFIGALIVDAAGEAPSPNERVLMLTRWFDGKYAGIDTLGTWKMMVNGASWPYTERLHYTAGDTVRWRVLNPMFAWHPMHLHGFYFHVTARGDNRLDTLYTPGQRRAAVTELMNEFSTMSMTWIPERPGNWLVHCHLIRHINSVQRIGFPRDATTRGDAHDSHDAHVVPALMRNHAEEHMAGLVMGINVSPRAGKGAAVARARASGAGPAERNERALRLVANTKPATFGAAPGYAFLLQEGSAAPAADSMRFPGAPITLYRGQPSRITVVNHIGTPLAVHWHGMEIESYYDGVSGWSGIGTTVRSAIAPGDSFAVRMTPPRAGTFIYHTHDESGDQLGSGLYGALLVLEPGVRRDTTRDHLVIIGVKGPNNLARMAINGQTTPEPLMLTANAPHRLRIVSIPASEMITVDLVRVDSLEQSWRTLASDGAELPHSQQAPRRARVSLSAGQTLDVEVRVDSSAAEPGRYALRVRTSFYPAAGRDDETLLLPIVLAH